MSNESVKKQLIQAAVDAASKAHAPYSNYHVGAALITTNGEVYSGANVENAAYPSSICAERVAIFKAVSEGYKNFEMLAIVTENGGMPCGACRQVISEFSKDLPIIIGDYDGNLLDETNISSLLPFSFGANDIS